MTVASAEQAELTAHHHLAASLPRRWTHVQAVAMKARLIGSHAVPQNDTELLVAAAWLHDIGYAPDIADTGLHALDGARWLVKQGFDRRLAGLVANHSCAWYEADERELAEVLSNEFPRERSAAADALWFADMTTGPDGQDLTVEGRLEEIRQRYGPDDVVTKFWRHAEPELLSAVQRTVKRLRPQPM